LKVHGSEARSESRICLQSIFKMDLTPFLLALASEHMSGQSLQPAGGDQAPQQHAALTHALFQHRVAGRLSAAHLSSLRSFFIPRAARTAVRLFHFDAYPRLRA
jgi:hypothetical protein